MNLDQVIFIDKFPKLDLHGYDRQTAALATNDFIRDNVKMKNKIVVIIHGIGSHIVKTAVHETLSKNKKVLEYQVFSGNVGCTIVNLSVDN